MMTARLKLKTLVAIMGLATVAAFPIYQHLLHEYQRKRVEAFFNPNSDGRLPGPAGAERDRLRAVLRQGVPARDADPAAALPGAVDRLPVRGVGRGVGLPRLPGCCCSPTWSLILWILKIAGEARDRFGATVCVGVAAMLFWHVIINIGMVSGTLPVVGVTLPLISYGGSSVLTIAAALGLVMNVSVSAASRTGKKQTLRARPVEENSWPLHVRKGGNHYVWPHRASRLAGVHIHRPAAVP